MKTQWSRTAALAVVVMLLAACSRQEAPPPPVRAVRTLVIAPTSAGASIEYAGEVRARTESRLGFRVGGKLLRRTAELGGVVKAGQVLAQLDPQDLRLSQQAAQAALVSAKVSQELAMADLKRYRELKDQGFISGAELERRETTAKAAAAAFDQARAQADVQGNQAAYASLVADAAGVVTGIEAEPGQVVSAGAPVVRLAHDGPRDVVFSVPEDKVGVIRALAAQPGRFLVRPWGAEAQPVPATIREIAAAADATTRTFLVKADIGRAAVQLGQTATVLVQMPQAAGVVKLPLTALKEEQGRSVVWLLDPKTMAVRLQPVAIAGADGNEAVIAGGLNAGDEVVTAGVHVLTPGLVVKRYVEPGHTAGTAQGAPASGTAASAAKARP